LVGNYKKGKGEIGMRKILSSLTMFFTLAILIPNAFSYNYFELPGIKGYKPPDPDAFPWKPPYTGEQLFYLRQASRRNAPFNMNVLGTYVNHQGHIRHEIYHPTEWFGYKDYEDKLTYDSGLVKAGDVVNRTLLFWAHPREVYGRGMRMWDYLDTPTMRKDADRWLYSPNLRRIRRLSGADRADTIGGGDFTYDDIIGREVFEWEYKILGEDLLYPDELAWDTKVLETIGIPLKVPKAPIRCVVVEAKPKLPDYYLSKIITWFTRPTKNYPCVDLREEHYDPEGFLWRIRSRYWSYAPKNRMIIDPDMPPIVWGRKTKAYAFPRIFHHLEYIWDITIDHRTIYHFDFEPYRWEWQDKIHPIKIFFPESMTEERDFVPKRFIDQDKRWPMYEDIRPLLPERHPLLLDRFPEHRPIKKELLGRDYIKKVLAREKANKAMREKVGISSVPVDDWGTTVLKDWSILHPYKLKEELEE